MVRPRAVLRKEARWIEPLPTDLSAAATLYSYNLSATCKVPGDAGRGPAEVLGVGALGEKERRPERDRWGPLGGRRLGERPRVEGRAEPSSQRGGRPVGRLEGEALR